MNSYAVISEPKTPTSDATRTVDNGIEQLSQVLPPFWKTYMQTHHNRIAFDVDLVKKYATPQARILECGAFPFLLTESLRKSGFNVAPVDIDPTRCQAAVELIGGGCIKLDIESSQWPIETETFDLVLFNELFEHLRINPIRVMSEVMRVIKPGGKLLLSTPNLRSIRGIYNFLFKNLSFSCESSIYEQYAKLDAIGHMGHVREYTTAEVTTFLRRVGFDIQTVIYRGQYGSRCRALTTLLPNLRPFFTLVACRKL